MVTAALVVVAVTPLTVSLESTGTVVAIGGIEAVSATATIVAKGAVTVTVAVTVPEQLVGLPASQILYVTG
jgi:hypothetical protein